MPTYDYGCKACGHRFERFESLSAMGAKECPSCGKKQARRLISAGGAVLTRAAGGGEAPCGQQMPPGG